MPHSDVVITQFPVCYTVLIQPEHTACRLYLFVEAAEISVLPHAVQDLRCCLYYFRTMSGNSAEWKKHIQYKARLSFVLC